MSKHKQKYPGLYAAAKANGISYITAYQRIRAGWSFERATTEPVHVPKIKPIPLTVEQREIARTAAWLSNARQQIDETFGAPKKALTPVGVIRYPDKSSAYIRRIRAALCDEFIKTGNLNVELTAKLKDYADECRTAKSNPERISAKHEAGHPRRGQAHGRYNGSRSDAQADGG